MVTSVLVVDDSSVSRMIVIKSLPSGWDVAITQAANGSEALIALAAKPHSIVFLDLNMPVMDGYQFLESLQAAPASQPRPIVIVLSGDIQPQAQARVAALGAQAFIKKPVRADKILHTLQSCGVL